MKFRRSEWAVGRSVARSGLVANRSAGAKWTIRNQLPPFIKRSISESGFSIPQTFTDADIANGFSGVPLKGVREQVIVATKFGNTFDESSRQKTGQDASAEGIRRACDESLRRLGTTYIDLYQFHLNDYDPKKAVEVLGTLEELVAAGKIRSYGWSTDFPERAKVFAEGKHNVAVQHELSVFFDAPEMLRFCEERGLASINRSPLAMGLLTASSMGDRD